MLEEFSINQNIKKSLGIFHRIQENYNRLCSEWVVCKESIRKSVDKSEIWCWNIIRQKGTKISVDQRGEWENIYGR